MIGDNGVYGDFVNRMGDLKKNGEKEMDTAMSILRVMEMVMYFRISASLSIAQRIRQPNA